MAVSGIGQADAYFLVAEVARAMRKRALGFFVVGGIAVLVGLLVTFATLQAAQSGGGRTYIVWWGPVIFGGMAAIYGLRLLSRVPRVP
jgi:lipopolysaccharide export LptBFGC system permease protein LptF